MKCYSERHTYRVIKKIPFKKIKGNLYRRYRKPSAEDYMYLIIFCTVLGLVVRIILGLALA